MICVLYGDEPYRIDYKKRKLIAGADVTYAVGSFGEELYSLAMTYPFMSQKRCIILDIDSLKDLDTAEFHEFMKQAPVFTDLVVNCRNADSRLRLFKVLKEAGILVECNKLKAEEDVKKVLQSELNAEGVTIQEDAMTLFLKKMNYPSEGMNLLTMVGYLKTLMVLTKQITVDDVKAHCPSFEEPNVFALTELLLSGDNDRLLREVNMIAPDDAIPSLSLLLRNFRISWKRRSFPDVSFGGMDKLSTLSIKQLENGMEILTATIKNIKNGVVQSDIALKLACGEIAALIHGGVIK